MAVRLSETPNERDQSTAAGSRAPLGRHSGTVAVVDVRHARCVEAPPRLRQALPGAAGCFSGGMLPDSPLAYKVNRKSGRPAHL
ncbi:hypothetical protein EYF80_058575 [Liparis tanakae]|uniref:Uncharacterized protein n=1 Tax=Liparis tanakae TaxID=230148 RepID=A0A4Z2ER57_9TELE|nr:hypothetical protein EYF80_058575 [Liparis tanakae]